MKSLPNLLTLARIVAIPVIVALFYVPGDGARWLAFALFVAAAITDFFDGWLARRMGVVSALGRFLDPIADKLLVVAVLLMLVAGGNLAIATVIAALVILLREVLVAGLREHLAEMRIGLPVSKLAKWKTAVQMVALALLLIGAAAPAGLPAQQVGEVALWLAAILTAVTGWDYLRVGLRHMRSAAS
ncbi:MAG TPA: CDP-diacylglycerol--glycerol-3-phosphate 3-phosphatidyltransferase [Magnetospirillaceae bacterium]|jgi:cardiolipin synthase